MLVLFSGCVGILASGGDNDPDRSPSASSAPSDEATAEAEEAAPVAGDDPTEHPPAEEQGGPHEDPEDETVADEPTEDGPTEDAALEVEEPVVEEDATAEPAEEAIADAGIGTPVEVGELSLTVTDVQTDVASVGDPMWETQANGEFVIVSFTITNDGSSPESVFSNDFMLLNDAGAEFATSSDAWHVEDHLSWEEINPGNSFTGVLVYDVPAGTNVTGLQVTVGWFSAPVSVDLAS